MKMNNQITTTTATAPTTAAIKLGARVQMTAENSNWNIGEKGTVTWLGGDRAAIAFDGREDDYTAFLTDFKTI
jgi:hypothetical protein